MPQRSMTKKSDDSVLIYVTRSGGELRREGWGEGKKERGGRGSPRDSDMRMKKRKKKLVTKREFLLSR